jgi:cellulose synthase/poly-beta-1,6-N-acetylglucosamine synthase-like glycosyltransferase
MLFWLALISLIFVTVAMADLTRGNRSIRVLRDIRIALPAHHPRVSVVIAARDEERRVEGALDSLLAQDYPDYEVIVVDDRSGDATPAILARKIGGNERLRVVRIDALPAGWLGKNYALHRGAHEASGTILIFADADIVMRPDTVTRAVAYALAARRDHIAMAPEVIAPGLLLGMFVGTFTMLFSLYARPWKAADPRSQCFIGIGAFNLVRTEVYRAVGGHARIAMRPDDDLKLGKIIKHAGYSQEMLFGRGAASVEWYPSLGELARGLEKNSLAGVDYSIVAMACATLAQAAFFIWPFVALGFTSGLTLALNAMICGVLLASYAQTARRVAAPRWYALGLPLMVAIFIGILWRSTFMTLRNDGITWRGTHYALAALKANQV